MKPLPGQAPPAARPFRGSAQHLGAGTGTGREQSPDQMLLQVLGAWEPEGHVSLLAEGAHALHVTQRYFNSSRTNCSLILRPRFHYPRGIFLRDVLS